MTKIRRTLSYIIAFMAVLVLSAFVLTSCGNPRKGLKIEYEVVSAQSSISYGSDGKAFLPLTKELDENGELTSAGKAEIAVKVVKGAKNLLRTIKVESSDPAKVGFDYWYDASAKVNHVVIKANGATAQDDSTYIRFISVENSKVFATIYVSVEEKATSMSFASNLEVANDNNGNLVVTNLGIFDGVPFHLLTNKMFRFGPSQATAPNLVYGVKDIYNFFDGSEFVYTSSEESTGIRNTLTESDVVTGTYADGVTRYKAIEFFVSNNDDKTNTIFQKKFRIPIYENLSSNVITVAKNNLTDSTINVETVFDQVQTPSQQNDYLGLYVFDKDLKTFVLVTKANIASLSIEERVTPAYQKANIDTRIVFINNKNNESNNISLSLEPDSQNISYTYDLVEPSSAYNYLTPDVVSLNRKSSYYGKYIKVNGAYKLIDENNFNSLGIIIGQTPCYSYSRTVAIVQNTDMLGNKTNIFTLSGWRESLSGTYLTFYASYEGFLIDNEITTIPTASKTIAIEVVNYPTQLFVNDKGQSYSVLKNNEGEVVSSFASIEEFLGADGSGLYYFRTGETINSYAYTLITKKNYSEDSKKIIINGTEYDLDYRNLAGTPIFEEAAQEISVFDVYHTDSLNESLVVELNGFSEGFDEFCVYVDAAELAVRGANYPHAIDLAEKLEFVYGGRIQRLKIAGEEGYETLVYGSGSRIYLSANTSDILTGIIPIVVEAKYNSGKKLQRRVILRFVNGVKTITAEATQEIDGAIQNVEVNSAHGIELAIPASGDMSSSALRSDVIVATLPEDSAKYSSLVDGVTRTYLSVKSLNTSIAKVGYYADGVGFVENQINPETLSFVVLGKKYGETEVCITAPSGVTLSFGVKIREVVSDITLNLDDNTIPPNTFQTTQKINENPLDNRTTLRSLMLEENVEGVVVRTNIYPSNALIEDAERFYITQTKYNEITNDSTQMDLFKATIYNYMTAISPTPLGEEDGIDTTSDMSRKIVVNVAGELSQGVVISTKTKDVNPDKNKCYVCIAYIYLDEHNQKQLAFNYFNVELYKAITGFVDASSSGEGKDDVQITLFSSLNDGIDYPYITSQTTARLSVDIVTTAGSLPNRTVSDVIWYFVNDDGALVTDASDLQRVENSLVFRSVKATAINGGRLVTYTKNSPVVNIPQNLQKAIGDGSYYFLTGKDLRIDSVAMTGQANQSYFSNLRACVVDVNGTVWRVKYNIQVTKITLIEDINVYDYDESDGIYFETAQKMTVLPAVGDELAVKNSYGFNDIDETYQSYDIDVSIAYQNVLPTLTNLEYILLDAVVDDQGRWSIDRSSVRTKQNSSSSVWLGQDAASNKYFVTPIKYGYTILYVLPQDHMIKKNEDITPQNIGDVLNAIKNVQVIKEFHITVADGYKTYIRLSSASDFEKLANNESGWDKNYYVTNDIDLSGTDLKMIGSESIPFSGKICTMPIVSSKTYYTFIVGSNTYYVVDNYVCSDVTGSSKVADYNDPTLGLIAKELQIDFVYEFEGEPYKYVDGKFVSGSYDGGNFVAGSTEIPITRDVMQTSTIPSYTIYGINLTDTRTEGGSVVSKIQNATEYSYFGFFGVFAGVVESVSFRFDSVTFETNITSGNFRSTIYLGAFAGKILAKGEYVKLYETVEGYYGKYAHNSNLLINESNALEYFEASAEVDVNPTISDISITVGAMNCYITKNVDANISGLYCGIIGANSANNIFGIDAQISAELNEKANIFKCVVGGFVGLNNGKLKNIEINVNIEAPNSSMNNGYVGGVIGENQAEITNIRANGKIELDVSSTNEAYAVGGICGSSSRNIMQARSSVEVCGGANVGGIAGIMSGASSLEQAIYSIYAGTTHAVYSFMPNSFVGGLVGQLDNSFITESYVMSYVADNTEEIYGKACAGGVVGKVIGDGSISKTFFSASVQASAVGGLVGIYSGSSYTIENCFVKGKIILFEQTGGITEGGISSEAGLLLANQNLNVHVFKAYVTAVGYVSDSEKTLTAQEMKHNTDVTASAGVYVLDTSFIKSGSEYLTTHVLTLEQMRDRTQIESTAYYKNINMVDLVFYNGLTGDWTVVEQNDQEPILFGLYPTIPTDIIAMEVESSLGGVYNVSNTEIIISLSDYYAAYGDSLERKASNFFKLKISPNSTSGFELVNTADESTAEGEQICQELRDIWLNIRNSNTSILETSASNLYDLKFIFSGKTGTTNITLSCAQNTNAQITLTISVIEGFDGFVFKTSTQTYNTTQTEEDLVHKSNLISIQKDLGKRIDIKYTQNQRVESETGVSIQNKDVLRPSYLNAGFAIMFKEGKFGFGADRFKETIHNGVVKTRQDILSEFKAKYDVEKIKDYYGDDVSVSQDNYYYQDGSGNYYLATATNYVAGKQLYVISGITYVELEREQAVSGRYYYMQNGQYVLVNDINYVSSSMFGINVAETTKTKEEVIQKEADSLLVFVDGYKYAKIIKNTEKTTYVFAYSENTDNLTVFAKDITESHEQIWFTKYYVLTNNAQKKAYYLNTEFCLFVKIYSGITELNVSGANNLNDVEKRSPSDEFVSEITFDSDSTLDQQYGVDAMLYLLNTRTIHASNTLVYDNTLGQNPQTYSTINSYYGKYYKVSDGEYVQITGANTALSDDGLMLILYLDGEQMIYSSTVDLLAGSRTNATRVDYLSKIIPGFTTYKSADVVVLQEFALALSQQYYKTLDEVLVFRLEVTNVDPDAQKTKIVYFEFAPIAVSDVSIHHYTDAELEEGDGTLASNYLTNAGAIPTDTILAGDYGLLEIQLIPEYGAFNTLELSGIGTNLDTINFVQRVKSTYTAKINDSIVTQTRYHLYAEAAQDLNQVIKPEAVSNYYDGTVSLMIGETCVHTIIATATSKTYAEFAADDVTNYYHYIDGNYVLVNKETITEENYNTPVLFTLIVSNSTLQVGDFAKIDYSKTKTQKYYYCYDGTYVLIKDLIDVNSNTKKLQVTEPSFDFDGTIYLQTLINKQITTATSFNIDVNVYYNGQTQHFSKNIRVDTSSTIAWTYDGVVHNLGSVNQEAYVAVGTINQNLHLDIAGEFTQINLEPVVGLKRDGGALSEGSLTITPLAGTSIYSVSTYNAKIGDVFEVTAIGYKNINGYVRQIKRTIVFRVVDYILKKNAFKIEESTGNVLSKVYTNDASYKINIVPNFDNIEISRTEPQVFESAENYIGYYRQDENHIFHLITSTDDVVKNETLAYTEELKNLYEYVYALNTDKYQVFGVMDDTDARIKYHELNQKSNADAIVENEYYFTKVEYKASTEKDKAESGGYFTTVDNMCRLPKDNPYYYVKYVYGDGANNGYYVCPRSQGYGSLLYINELAYQYVNGKLVIVGGLKTVSGAYDPYSSEIYSYTDISGYSFENVFTQTVARYGTEIRFTQKTSIENPIPIYTTEEFFNMGAGNHYILMNDLVFMAESGTGWNPINTAIASLDGNGKLITVKYSTFNTSSSNIGFFGTVQSETLLKNLTIRFADMNSIDCREIGALNFGLLAGTNNGIITNCEVTVDNDNDSVFTQATITLLSSDRIDDEFSVGGFVGVNNNSITNSRTTNIALTAYGLVAGFVCENNGIISASYTNFGMVRNASTQTSSSRTGGFVVKNAANSKILSSYVGMAYLEEYNSGGSNIIQEVKQTQTVSSNVNMGGFVYENFGTIEDAFSAIKLVSDTASFNASSGGFVFNNQVGGKVLRCYSISSTQEQSFANAPFIGSNQETGYKTLNYGTKDAFVDCLYYNESFGSSIVKLTEELDIKSLTKEQFLNSNNYYADCFEDYSVARFNENGGYEFSTVWAFASSIYSKTKTDDLLISKLRPTGSEKTKTRNLLGPQLVYANLELYSNKEVLSYNESDPASPKYEYTENNLRLKEVESGRTKFNVRIINSASSLITNFEADLEDGVLDDWYRLVCNLDLSGVDLSKYVNQVFEGNFDGNGFTISGVNITSSKADYCGFFGKVQTKTEYDLEHSVYKQKDLTVASVHNINFVVNAITATEVIAVGGVCGVAENAILSNIKVSGKDPTDIQIIGKNIVGGVVGKLYGNTRAYNIISEISVSAVYSETYTNKLIYNADLLRVYTKKVDDKTEVLPSGASTANADSNVCYAGAVFGVADLVPFNLTSAIVSKTAYSESRISNVIVQASSKVVGGTVGGAIGLVGASTYVNNMHKIVVDGTYVKGGRFAGGLVGENRGILNFARVTYESALQDIVDLLDVGASNSQANIDLFRSQSATFGEQAKAIGGLVGLNIGLSLSLVSDVECGVITNSFTKVRVDDSTAGYLGGLVGIAIGGNFNSNFVTGSVVGARVGTTGGIIGFVADFDNVNIKQIIANPFESVAYDSFMLKDKKYLIEDNKIYDITQDRTEIQTFNDSAPFIRFVVDGTNYYLNEEQTIVYTSSTVGDNPQEETARAKMVALVNKRKYLSMDSQTLTLNNIVAKNNYSSLLDFNRIKAIAGSGTNSNGTFGAFIGMASLNSIIETSHKALEGGVDSFDPSITTTEYNFYVSTIYSSNESFGLSGIGYDMREMRIWESFVEGTHITLNGNSYERESNRLIKDEIVVSHGEFSIDNQTLLVIDDNVYYLTFVSTLEPTSPPVANKAGFNIGEDAYYINIDGDYNSLTFNEASAYDKEIKNNEGSLSPIVRVGSMNGNANGTYTHYTFMIEDVRYVLRGNAIFKLNAVTMNESTFNFGSDTFELDKVNWIVTSSNNEENIDASSHVTTHGGYRYYIEGNEISSVGKYYIGEANNVYKVDTNFEEIATGLTRAQMDAGSYSATHFNDRMFSHWNIYDYGTKQADDTFKITNFDSYKMPQYNPSTDVDEIKIYTVEDFKNMKTTGTYRLMNDLDFEYENICLFVDEPFTGTFIGASDSTGSGETVHTLYNVNPTKENSSGQAIYAGIFSKTQNATIKKLNISGVAKKDTNGNTTSIELNNTIVDFGILIGNAVDTQVSDINITENYNYISSYVNYRLNNTFAMSGAEFKTLYKLEEVNNPGEKSYRYTPYAQQESIITQTTEGKTFVIGGTTYYLFVDGTKENPYSYSATNNASSAIEIEDDEFQLVTGDGNPVYCIDRNYIYKKFSSAQPSVNIGVQFKMNDIDYQIEERVVYNMTGSMFKINGVVYQIQDDDYIFTKNAATNMAEHVATIYDGIFLIDGVTYKYSTNQIKIMTISQTKIENNIMLTNSSKLMYVGGLIGRYEVQDIVQNNITNINIETDLSISGSDGSTITSVEMGGAIGNAKGSNTYYLQLKNVVFDGKIATTKKIGEIGGIVGRADDVLVTGALVLGDIDVTLPDSYIGATPIYVGGFAGQLLISEFTENITYCEGITVLNNITADIVDKNFMIGGFAGEFTSRLFNSVVAPNISLKSNTSSFLSSNASVAGLAPTISTTNFRYGSERRTVKAIQNVLVATTTYNSTNFDHLSAVCDERFTALAGVSNWSYNLRYDKNVSLIPREQSYFASTTEEIMNFEINSKFTECVYNVANSDSSGNFENVGDQLDFLLSYLTKEENSYPIFRMSGNHNYAYLEEKLKQKLEAGDKLQPLQVVSSNPLGSQEFVTLSEIDAETNFKWYLQKDNMSNISLLETINLNGFYNGNNKTLTLKEIDGAFGQKTDKSQVGVFNVNKNATICSLSVMSQHSTATNMITTTNMAIVTDNSDAMVGVIASVMDKNSYMFACYSYAKLQIQSSNKPLAVGGLVGRCSGQIIACGSNAELYVGGTNTKHVGGLAGYFDSTNVQNAKAVYIRNSFYNGVIRTPSASGATENLGGICGYVKGTSGSGTVNMKNCYVATKFVGKEGYAVIGAGDILGSNVFYDNKLNSVAAGQESLYDNFNIVSSMAYALPEAEPIDGYEYIKSTKNEGFALPTKSEWIRKDGAIHVYSTVNYCNSGLPISALLSGVAMEYNVRLIGEAEGVKTLQTTIKNEAELKYYLENYQQKQILEEATDIQNYVLTNDLDWTTVQAYGTGSTFTFTGLDEKWSVDGTGHKISNLNANFVANNGGVIQNIEFDGNTNNSVVATNNSGSIREILLENGENIVETSSTGSVVNCLAGTNAIRENSNAGLNQLAYQNIETTEYDLGSAWTIVGVTNNNALSEKGTLKLQQFNKTTSNIDVFGIDGGEVINEESGLITYTITNKEQYSAIVQYLNRHSGLRVVIKLSYDIDGDGTDDISSIDFNDINVTTMQGRISLQSVDANDKKLTNINVANTPLFNSSFGAPSINNVVFDQVNFYVNPEESTSAALFAASNAQSTNVKITNSLINYVGFRSGANITGTNVQNASLMFVGTASALSQITLDNIVVNAVVSGNFGLVSGNNNGATIDNVSVKDVKLKLINYAAASNSTMNGGVVAGSNKGTIQNVEIGGTEVDLDKLGASAGVSNFGGVAGTSLESGEIQSYKIGNSNGNLRIVGAATNIGGVVGIMSGTASVGITSSADPNSTSIITKLYVDSNEANNIGGLVGRNDSNTTAKTVVKIYGTITSGNYSIELIGSGNIGGIAGTNNGRILNEEIEFDNGSSVVSYDSIRVATIHLSGELKDSLTTSTANIGGLVGVNQSSIGNTNNPFDSQTILADSIKITGKAYNVGGLIAQHVSGGALNGLKLKDSIINIANENNTQTENIGGIVGEIKNNVKLYASIDNLRISGKAVYVGGYVGSDVNSTSSYSAKIYDLGMLKTSDNTAGVIIDVDAQFIGGVLGYAGAGHGTAVDNGESSHLDVCNKSIISIKSSNEEAVVGGMVGYAGNAGTQTVLKEYVVQLQANSKQHDFGGLVGYAHNTGALIVSGAGLTVSTEANSGGNNFATENVGGVVGTMNYAANIAVQKNVTLTSNTTATNVGGVVGTSVCSSATARDGLSVLSNETKVSVIASQATNVGGIMGLFDESSSASTLPINVQQAVEITAGNVDYVGGWFGRFDADTTNITVGSVGKIKIEDVSAVNVPRVVGGVVGTSTTKFEFDGAHPGEGVSASTLSVKTGAQVVGGIMGVADGKDKTIEANRPNVDVTLDTSKLNIKVESVATNNKQEIGGIVGRQGNVVISGGVVQVDPHSTLSINAVINSNPQMASKFVIDASDNTNSATCVGGVVAKNITKIRKALVSSITLTGLSNVGGITGINEGAEDEITYENYGIVAENNNYAQILGNVHITAQDKSGLFVGVNNGDIIGNQTNANPIVINDNGANEVNYSGTSDLGIVVSVNTGFMDNAFVKFNSNNPQTFTIGTNATNVGFFVANNSGIIQNNESKMVEGTSSVSLQALNSNNVGIIGVNTGIVSTKQVIDAQNYSIAGSENVGAIGYLYKDPNNIALGADSGTFKFEQFTGYAGIVIGSVSGKYAGAIGYNNSSNLGSSIKAKIDNIDGNFVGGIIGRNAYAFNSTSTNFSVYNSTFNTNAINVGGIIGLNEAAITGLKATISSTIIRGDENVGGFAGCTNASIAGVEINENQDGVTIQGRSYVGGWFGAIASTVVIDGNADNIIKTASVGTNVDVPGGPQASQNVGGIAGINNGTIQNIANNSSYFGEINGVNAVGGIVGVNGGTIINAQNNLTLAKDGSQVYYASNVGGIAGINVAGHSIGSSGADASKHTKNLATIGGISNVGGIVGYNYGTVSGSSVETGADTTYVTGKTNVGGVAGINSGTLTSNTVSVNVQYKGYDSNSQTYNPGESEATVLSKVTWNVGGIAGYNSGTIGGANSADRNTISNMHIAGHTIVGGVVGYNTSSGTVNTTNVSGTVKVVFVGIDSYKLDVNSYNDIYIINGKYLGTNLNGDQPNNKELQQAIVTALFIFAKDSDVVNGFASAYQATDQLITAALGLHDKAQVAGVVGRAIGYDAKPVSSSDSSISDGRSLLSGGTIKIITKQTSYGDFNEIPSIIYVKYDDPIGLDPGKKWLLYYTNGKTNVNNEYVTDRQEDVGVYEKIT